MRSNERSSCSRSPRRTNVSLNCAKRREKKSCRKTSITRRRKSPRLQPVREARKTLAAVSGYQEIILDSHPAEAVAIHSRLERAHTSFPQHFVGSGNEERRFVGVTTESMPGMMKPVLGPNFRFQHVINSLVYFFRPRARP